MTDRLMLKNVGHGLVLLSPLTVIAKMKTKLSADERIKIAGALRDAADELELRIPDEPLHPSAHRGRWWQSCHGSERTAIHLLVLT